MGDEPAATEPVSAAAEDATSVAGAVAAEAEIARLSEELREANQRALRWQAELENFRKRVRREMEDERRYASLPVISDLLGVFDNLQRAIEASEQHEQASGLRDGVKMVASQLATVLAKHHCQPIDAVGKPFDPHVHEALMQVPTEEHPPGTVVSLARAGYQMHDRVIRPAQVLVSRTAEAAVDTASAEGEDT